MGSAARLQLLLDENTNFLNFTATSLFSAPRRIRGNFALGDSAASVRRISPALWLCSANRTRMISQTCTLISATTHLRRKPFLHGFLGNCAPRALQRTQADLF